MSEPDPTQVLKEAETAAKAGRYKEALEKHVWYHENALRIDSAQAGVRLSYALSGWRRLANRYPPALAKLRAIRDETVQQVYWDEANSQLFSDVAALNEVLDESGKTVELFRWFDTKKPYKAWRAYSDAQDVLVEHEEYELCGKYLDPKSEFEFEVHCYTCNMRIVAQRESEDRPELAEALRDYARKRFSNSSCTMVALLALNDRKPEADAYTAKAKAFLDDAELHASLDKALQGVVPERWPPIDRRLWEEDED